MKKLMMKIRAMWNADETMAAMAEKNRELLDEVSRLRADFAVIDREMVRSVKDIHDIRLMIEEMDWTGVQRRIDSLHETLSNDYVSKDDFGECLSDHEVYTVNDFDWEDFAGRDDLDSIEDRMDDFESSLEGVESDSEMRTRLDFLRDSLNDMKEDIKKNCERLRNAVKVLG